MIGEHEREFLSKCSMEQAMQGAYSSGFPVYRKERGRFKLGTRVQLKSGSVYDIGEVIPMLANFHFNKPDWVHVKFRNGCYAYQRKRKFKVLK